ncbi:hypothetical protein BKA56DRAFT_276555 [Ilyonectria sp. MPI-CAGE-AT-0026]|nr:hypothetical protein BKA56DRAFT_276555 [Ilyonectria sp. MPI-CAGE-AT-0026]
MMTRPMRACLLALLLGQFKHMSGPGPTSTRDKKWTTLAVPDESPHHPAARHSPRPDCRLGGSPDTLSLPAPDQHVQTCELRCRGNLNRTASKWTTRVTLPIAGCRFKHTLSWSANDKPNRSSLVEGLFHTESGCELCLPGKAM